MTQGATRLLPPTSIGGRGLFFVVVALCFLATFMSLIARMTFSAASDWTARATSEVTIRVLGNPGSDLTVLDIVQDISGIASARVVDRAEAERLLEPWLGASLPADIPLPGVVAARVLPGNTDIGKRLAARLEATGLDVRIDDHFVWSLPLRNALQSLQIIAVGILVILWTITVLVISFATRTALVAHHDIVEVLHLAGALDRFIASLFERRFFILGLRAGAAGAFIAFIACWAIGAGAQRSQEYVWLTGHMALVPIDFVVFAMTPVLSGLSATGAARATALHMLSNLV